MKKLEAIISALKHLNLEIEQLVLFIKSEDRLSDYDQTFNFALSKLFHHELIKKHKKNSYYAKQLHTIVKLAGTLPLSSHTGKLLPYELLKENLEFILSKSICLSCNVDFSKTEIRFFLWKFAVDINEISDNKMENINIPWVEKHIYPINYPRDPDFERRKIEYKKELQKRKRKVFMSEMPLVKECYCEHK